MTRLGAPGMTASTVSTYAAVAGQAVRTLIVARVLGPQKFGVLNITNIFANLTLLGDFSTGAAGEQRASEARAREDHVTCRWELLNASKSRMFPAWVLFAVAGLGTIVASSAILDTLALAMMYIAVSAPLQTAWMTARGFLRVTGKFQLMMWAQFAQVLTWITIVPLAAVYWGLAGALAAMIFSYIPFLMCTAVAVPVHLFFAASYSAFRSLLRQGLALWFIQVSSFLFVYVDQILIAVLLGSAATGLYGVAMLAATAVFALSDGAASAGYVKTLEEVTRRGRLGSELPSVTTVMHLVQLGFGFLVPLSWLSMGALIELYLSDFVSAIPAMVCLTAAAAFTGVVNASNAALVSVDLHRAIPIWYAIASVVKVVAALVLIPLIPNLLAVGVAVLIASAVFAFMFLNRLSHAFRQAGGFHLLREHLSGPFILAAAAIATAATFERWGISGFWVSSVASLVVSAVLHIYAYLQWSGRFALITSEANEGGDRE